MSIASMLPSSHLILWCPLLLLHAVLPSFSVFSSELAFHIRWLNIGASASAFPMNIQGWFPLGWNGWIALLSKGLSRVFSSITIQKHRIFSTQPSLWSSLLYGPTLWSFTSIHDYSKKHSFDYTDLCWHSDVSDFLILCLGLSYLFFQGASIF